MAGRKELGGLLNLENLVVLGRSGGHLPGPEGRVGHPWYFGYPTKRYPTNRIPFQYYDRCHGWEITSF